MKWWWGLVAAAAGAGIGAAIAYEETPPCPPNPDVVDKLTCDPKVNAVVGAGTGMLLVGAAGAGAAVAPETRAAGLTAMAATIGLGLVSKLVSAAEQGMK